MRVGPRGGKLKAGNPGNKGGRGRPPSAIRKLARETWWSLAPRFKKIAQGEPVPQAFVLSQGADPEGGSRGSTVEIIDAPPKVADQVKAWVELGKLGTGENVSMEDVRERLEQQMSVIKAHVNDPEKAEALIQALSDVWVS
jgi:hypothetical protein